MTVINNRVDWIDSLRGYVMFLVVLGHNDNLPEIITTWIYSFHVPCFFIISGFFLNKWFYERAFFPKLISLSKKLLVPYLLYGFILTCFLALKEDNYLEALMNFSISLFYGNGNHWPVWFISALFTAQLFFYFFKKWKISLLLLGVLCVVAFLITELCNWKNLPWEMDLVPVVGIFILGGNFLYTRILSKVDKCGMVWYGDHFYCFGFLCCVIKWTSRYE